MFSSIPQQQLPKKFINFKWSPNNGDLLVFDSKHHNGTSGESNNNKTTIKIQRDQILCEIRKFYNEIYSHFTTLQTLINDRSINNSVAVGNRSLNGSGGIIPDERVREISAISNRYQSVLLAATEQIQKSLDTGYYLDYDDDSLLRENPFDEDLVIREKPRIMEAMKESKEHNLELIVFCGSINSIYPLLCARVSRELGVKCNLIARESSYEVSPRYQMALKGIHSILTVLNKKQYAQRIQYINENFKQLNNLNFVECDDLYQKYKIEFETLQVISIIWKIIHLFYFSPMISPHQLLDCLRFERQTLQNKFNDMTQLNVLETDEAYNYINQLLVNGCIDEAIHILNLHSRLPKSSHSVKMSSSTMRKSPLGGIIELLQRMPIRRRSHSNATAAATSNEYLSLWTKWHQEAEDLRMTYNNSVDSHLQEILDIVAGHEPTVFKYTNGFLSSVIASILFVEHMGSTQQIRQLFLRSYQRLTDRSIVDRILLSFATTDLESGLKRTAKYFPSWLVTHLTDLLYHHPYILKKHPSDVSPLANIRDGFLVDYAQYLASDSALVEVACNYLQFTKKGAYIIDEIIARQPITNEKQALKLLQYCQTEETEKLIYRMLSMEDYKNQRYASAISWLMKGRDSERISQLSNYLLSEKLDSNLLDDLQSLVETKMSEIPLYKELDFLIKYKELITLWKNKNFEDYSKCFCGMLRDKVVPKTFWIRLLLDIIPLLESSRKVYFGYDDTILLLNCLEDISSPHLIDQYLDGVSDSEIQTLRLALARNVSKSLMFSPANQQNQSNSFNNSFSPNKYSSLNNNNLISATNKTNGNIINSTIFTMK